MKPILLVGLAFAFISPALAITHDPNHQPPAGVPLTAKQADEVQKLQKVVPETGDVPSHYELGVVDPAPTSVDGERTVGSVVLPRDEAPASRSATVLVEANKELRATSPLLRRLPELLVLLLAMATLGYGCVKYMDRAVPYQPRRRRRIAPDTTSS